MPPLIAGLGRVLDAYISGSASVLIVFNRNKGVESKKNYLMEFKDICEFQLLFNNDEINI